LKVATGAYCIAIAHLINHSKDAQGAIAAATSCNSNLLPPWLQSGLAAALQQVRSPVRRSSASSGADGLV
jgi:hypothetical protein